MKDRAYEIARDHKHHVYLTALVRMVNTYFDKKTGVRVSVIENRVEELYKPVFKKFKRRNMYARFKGNI